MSETTTTQEFNPNSSSDYINLTEDILKGLAKDYYSNIDNTILNEIEQQFFKPSSSNPSDPNGIDSWSEYMVQNAKKGLYETIITFNSPIKFNSKSPIDIANMIIKWFKEKKGFNNVKYHSSELDHIVNLIISWDVKDTESEDPTFFDQLQNSIETYEATLKSLYYE
jgi:hypothetical protein